MEPAMSILSCHSQGFAASAPDSRADGGVRTVRISQRGIRIERLVAGIKMHVVVPINTYEGVILTCDDRADLRLYRVALVHHDTELSVLLHEAIESPAVLTVWRSWAEYFSKPAIYRETPNAGQTAHPNIAGPRPRRRGQRHNDRRPRFLKRRRCGRVSMVLRSAPKI